MSFATLPRPAHGGVTFPEDVASSEADRGATWDDPTSEKHSEAYFETSQPYTTDFNCKKRHKGLSFG